MASYREKDGRWEARVSLGFDPSGKRRVVAKRFDLKREAEVWAKTQELAPRAAKAALGDTVASLSAARLAYREDEGMSAAHMVSVRHFHDEWIVPGLGKEKLSKITTARLRDWSAWMKDNGVSDNQRRKAINELKAMFLRAEEEGVISSNPARLLRPPAEKKREAKPVPPEALPALLACGDPLVSIAVRLGADTGARRSNILGLRFCDIEGTTVRFVYKVVEGDGGAPAVEPGSKTGEKTRVVTISQDTADAVVVFRRRAEETAVAAGGVLRADGFVVSAAVDHSEPMRPRTFYGRWNKALTAAGLNGKGLQFKGLRHLAASHLLMSGMDPVRVAARLGHSVDVLLSTYSHLLPGEDDEKAANIMGGLLRQDG